MSIPSERSARPPHRSRRRAAACLRPPASATGPRRNCAAWPCRLTSRPDPQLNYQPNVREYRPPARLPDRHRRDQLPTEWSVIKANRPSRRKDSRRSAVLELVGAAGDFTGHQLPPFGRPRAHVAAHLAGQPGECRPCDTRAMTVPRSQRPVPGQTRPPGYDVESLLRSRRNCSTNVATTAPAWMTSPTSSASPSPPSITTCLARKSCCAWRSTGRSTACSRAAARRSWRPRGRTS